MKDAMHRGDSVVAEQQGSSRKAKKRLAPYCSVCNNRIWFGPISLREPEGVPEPRLSWILCKECHGAVVDAVRQSPVRSPLRLRIAMGIVAAERWPNAYPTRFQEYRSDRRWIVFMAACFIVAMLLHLALIVMIAGLH